MKYQHTEFNNFIQPHLYATKQNHNFDEKSLGDNLMNLERCIEEKNLSHGLDIVRQLIKYLPAQDKPMLKNYKENIINDQANKFGALKIVKELGEVKLKGQPIDFTKNEFSLLMMLVENPNQVISRDTLYQSILKTDYDGLNRSIDNTVARIRRKLGDNKNTNVKIKSIRGKGYLFCSDNC